MFVSTFTGALYVVQLHFSFISVMGTVTSSQSAKFYASLWDASLTADRLAQLVERRTTRAGGLGFESQTGPTLRILKIIEENMLPLQLHLQKVRYSSLLG